MQTYLFYDIETTGLNKAFDQVLQFAAIRTDLDLNELERHELKVKLNPDIIPSPRAILTHHIGIREAQTGIPEIEAIKKIHQWMNTPGTISVGYNTLGFDDEFLRFSFYRNLLSPYTHQYANQCSRMDMYPMAMMYYLFKNPIITWPELAGKISLKLEELNNANQFVRGRAHDAMIDVEITVELARRFFTEREMWNYVNGYFNKNIDNERSAITGFPNEMIMAYGKIGVANNFLCPVLFLGNHLHYKNQSLWLRLDSEKLSLTSLDALKETTWVMRKKLGEPGFVLPYKDRFLKKMKPEILNLAESNKKWLLENLSIYEKIVDYYRNELYPYYSETDIDARLYLDGFWSDEETRFNQRFHPAEPHEKALMIENIKNERIKTLGTRLLGRNYPEYLTSTQAEQFSAYIKKMHHGDSASLIDFRGKEKFNLNAALSECDELKNEKIFLSPSQLKLLHEYEDYLLSLHP